MRKYHLWVGVLIVVVILVTGQFMRHHEPPMSALSDSTRLMFRSRHIYLLASGLVNLMLGLYLRQAEGWRGIGQMIGSGLALLTLALTVEPERGFQTEMWWSAASLYAQFGGCMCHLASGIGKPHQEPEAKTARPVG
jgi:hypothetical protein